MFGWRGRIGVIVSPPNTVVEGEFSQMAPEGVSVHAARLGRPEGLAGQLGAEVILQTNDDLPRAAKSLSELRLDVVVFAHTAGSMVRELEYDTELVNMMETAVGCPAITTAGAVVAALTQAGVKRLALLTPYPEQMTLMEQEYLEAAVPGLKVISSRSLSVSSGLAIGDMEPIVAYRESKKIDTEQADALFLSGTNWRTVDVVEMLESDLSIPVFSANQVTMWAVLSRLGISARPGYGGLMDQI